MNQFQFSGPLIVWLLSISFMTTLIWLEFRRVHFNFNVLFSLLFLVVFYFGFPLTNILTLRFFTTVVSDKTMIQSFLLTISFYSIYYLTYKVNLKLTSNNSSRCSLFTINRVESHLFWILLMGIALICLAVFFAYNGFLLLKLNSYNQIFSSQVSGVALKRFFYFFIPAMLVVYFIWQKKKMWIFCLISTVVFGLLTYTIIGGTRANIFIALSIFLFIGIIHGWISLWVTITASVLGVIGMFWLALKRYGLSVNGDEAFYTFLYLTRDTFSPWENLAILVQNYKKIKFQWLSPIVRDFYVFIPNLLWSNRPKIVLNTANYFTWKILHNYSGLTMSPTLIGSLIIMGGIWFILPGATVVGLIIRWFDWLYMLGRKETNYYKSAILQSFCFSSIVNLIILTREGLDAFISRMVFFTLVFSACLLLAKLICWLLDHVTLIYSRSISNIFL